MQMQDVMEEARARVARGSEWLDTCAPARWRERVRNAAHSTYIRTFGDGEMRVLPLAFIGREYEESQVDFISIWSIRYYHGLTLEELEQYGFFVTVPLAPDAEGVKIPPHLLRMAWEEVLNSSSIHHQAA